MNIHIHLLVVFLCSAFTVWAQEPVKAPPAQEELRLEPVQIITMDDRDGGSVVPPDAPQGEDQVFTIVEQMPEFPGGSDAMMNYLVKNITYPAVEKEANIQGKVYIGMVIDKEGAVRDVKVLRGVPGGPGLDKEAMRVVKSMPKWIPGKQNGKAVAVQYNLPVQFKLQ